MKNSIKQLIINFQQAATMLLAAMLLAACEKPILNEKTGSEVPTDEEVPSNVAKIKFYYVGGSSTFSPKDGYGCVNSKQTEIRTVAADGVYEIYTLPHTEEDVLTKLTVTALDANDNTIKERIFENVPVVRNQVTRYTGSFFGSDGGGQTGSGGKDGGDSDVTPVTPEA